MLFNCFVRSRDITLILTPILVRFIGSTLLGMVSPGTHREILTYFGQD